MHNSSPRTILIHDHTIEIYSSNNSSYTITRYQNQNAISKGAPAQESCTGIQLVSPAIGCVGNRRQLRAWRNHRHLLLCYILLLLCCVLVEYLNYLVVYFVASLIYTNLQVAFCLRRYFLQAGEKKKRRSPQQASNNQNEYTKTYCMYLQVVR